MISYSRFCFSSDGNCQMTAISDQLFEKTDKAHFVRRKIVTWLRDHSNWQLVQFAISKKRVVD
jgi:hypothetical protein